MTLDDHWTWTDLVLDDVSTDVVSAVVCWRQPWHTTRFTLHVGHLRHRGWSGPLPRVSGGHGGRRRRRVVEPGACLGRHAELVGLSVQQAQHPEARTNDRRSDMHPRRRRHRDETLLHVVADHRSSTVTGRRKPRDRTWVTGHVIHLDIQWSRRHFCVHRYLSKHLSHQSTKMTVKIILVAICNYNTMLRRCYRSIAIAFQLPQLVWCVYVSVWLDITFELNDFSPRHFNR